MRPHIIQPGEHLTGLCARIGADPEEVWNDGENSEIRELRDDWTVLAPGDIVFLPDPAESPRPLQAHTTNRYQVDVPTTRLHMRLHEGNAAIANEPYLVDGTEPAIEGTTDGEGNVQLDLPATTEHVSLVLPERGQRIALLVGHLDPTETESGVRSRLANLGYLAHAERSARLTDEESADELARAVLRFQDEQGLEPSGELDAPTRSALSITQGA